MKAEDILKEEGWRHERERLKAAKPRDFRMSRPQLSIPPTQQELEQAFQRLGSMCDAYETMIEMKNERIEELEATLAMYEGKD